jgi:heat-inducible transcriptional repressor
LLSQLTKQVALVQYPSLGRSSVRHIELVSSGGTKLLIILIADTGRIEQRTVEMMSKVTEDFLHDLRTRLNVALDGQLFTEVPDRLVGLAEHFALEFRPAVNSVVATILDAVISQNEERVVVGGTSNLARVGEDFTTAVGPVLEALEEHVVLLRLFGEAAEPDSLTVRIGHENPVEELQRASVVTVGYGSGDQALATMGVLGPTRMDYAGSMGAVRAVAKYVGQILKEQ